MAAVIEVSNVTKKFGDDTVLRNINIRFEEGRIYGIVGRNGSGKTVLLKLIAGFLRVSDGQIRVYGKEVGKDKDFSEKIGLIIENPGFLSGYTGYKNLEFLAGIRNMISKKEIRDSMERVGLDPDCRKKVGKYSLGMKQRLAIAQAIMEDPKILILDEPMNGLDDEGVEDIRKMLLQLKEDGKTVLLASHDREDIEILCDEVYEMNRGRLQKVSATISRSHSAF